MIRGGGLPRKWLLIVILQNFHWQVITTSKTYEVMSVPQRTRSLLCLVTLSDKMLQNIPSSTPKFETLILIYTPLVLIHSVSSPMLFSLYFVHIIIVKPSKQGLFTWGIIWYVLWDAPNPSFFKVSGFICSNSEGKDIT